MLKMQNQLEDYKKQINLEISDYKKRLLKDWESQYTSYSVDIIKTYFDLLERGGKRLRGSLTITAYKMLGGEDQKLILRAALIIEMIHAYLLIIDDIADKSELRRGAPTVHKLLEKYHRDQNYHGDSQHFGQSMAMHAAIAGLHLALKELGQLPVKDLIKLEAMNNLNEVIITTINGQFNDVMNEVVKSATSTQINKVLIWKTAYYSFLNPLEFGMILAQADNTDLQYIKDYAINMGISFQITDDILGLFGDKDISGKNASDDLKEGKITLLTSRALDKASAEQKQRLQQILGNDQITDKDIEDAKQIIQDTGALSYAQDQAKNYSTKAARSIEDTPNHWGKAEAVFLKELAQYVYNRSS